MKSDVRGTEKYSYIIFPSEAVEYIRDLASEVAENAV